MLQATWLLHFNPQLLHVGENHVLHRLAKMSQSNREEKKRILLILQTLEALKEFKGEICTTSPLLWVARPTCNVDYG